MLEPTLSFSADSKQMNKVFPDFCGHYKGNNQGTECKDIGKESAEGHQEALLHWNGGPGGDRAMSCRGSQVLCSMG